MTLTNSWAWRQREEMWRLGRSHRDRLLAWYCREYGRSVPPPPALIVDELLTDGLGADLRFDPLPPDRFAQTTIKSGVVVVTINTLTVDIAGVKDDVGVQNVAKCHELIHVAEDQDRLQVQPGKLMFPGFDAPMTQVCLRASGGRTPSRFDQREYRAEEAGRAFAVSVSVLRQSEAFVRFMDVGRANGGDGTPAWSLLYQAARDIGVNISAVVKQLELEGHIHVERSRAKPRIFVTRTLHLEEETA